MEYRHLLPSEIEVLQSNFCTAENWDNVKVVGNFLPEYVKHIEFSGEIRLGFFEKEHLLYGGLRVHSGLSNARIHNCTIGNNVFINKIHNYIANYNIGDDSYIENTNIIAVDGESSFGNGVLVPVMNEGGGREIPIFDYLSSHLAYILTLYRHNKKLIENLQTLINNYALSKRSSMGTIGRNVRIVNCGLIKDVCIGDYARLGGVAKLKNGTINSNEKAPVKIGSGVKCNDFIISSGGDISDSTLISRCFIGQGCIMGKHYSALDSLFFSNCQGLHGEATAIFAGPYTVSHHKSSLLIAGMFSFLNAGSGSNQSNHMYKLGPIHQGVAERGSKTTSDSYLLWPARIGAFTLVMGRHIKHFDTSNLPFSYLIENATESYLVPAVNLRSVGTIRDAQKWPKRDNRKDAKTIDKINFNLLSPYTMQKVDRGIDILKDLQEISGETTELYAFQNCMIKNSSLNKGLYLYRIVMKKFLGNSLISRLGKDIQYYNIQEIRKRLKPQNSDGLGEWRDLSGLLAPESIIQILISDIENNKLTLDDIQNRFEMIHSNYYEYEWTWAYEKLLKYWDKLIDEVSVDDIESFIDVWLESVITLDTMIYNDAKKEFNLNSQTGFGVDGNNREKSLDFESVRGRFEDNPFVKEVKQHVQRKTDLGKRAKVQIANAK